MMIRQFWRRSLVWAARQPDLSFAQPVPVNRYPYLPVFRMFFCLNLGGQYRYDSCAPH